MMNRQGGSVQTQRFTERRRREDEAPRLSEQVPGLVSLRLEIEERAGHLAIHHIRHVVVDRAPALFVLRCGDGRCNDGEHDLTATVMQALRARMTTFAGDDECNGSLGSLQAPCGRVLHFDAVASYQRGEHDEAPGGFARATARLPG